MSTTTWNNGIMTYVPVIRKINVLGYEYHLVTCIDSDYDIISEEETGVGEGRGNASEKR